MLNHIVLMGRLVRDPELRYTQQGTAVAMFTLAVDRNYSKDASAKQTDFIDVVAWRQTGEYVANYFTKGRMAVVSGRLQIRTREDNNGTKRKIAEVVADSVYFGDSKKDGSSGNQTQSRSTHEQSEHDPYPGYSSDATDFAAGEQDELPF